MCLEFVQASKHSTMYTDFMYIKVRVTAGAKREAVTKVSKSSYKISVREPAERNLANTRVIELVAIELHVLANKVRIINGHQSPSKMLSIQE